MLRNVKAQNILQRNQLNKTQNIVIAMYVCRNHICF